jgi:hypothetical protein
VAAGAGGHKRGTKVARGEGAQRGGLGGRGGAWGSTGDLSPCYWRDGSQEEG